ncbi:hypothetical protein [Mesorhizobium sp. B2-3-14]|uniref:hypothetical protein n=1 Tax=Mesorhizobium sp. B2-3-14 TaxID=2589950 RepID=UPI0015E27204|nr:hypothetical protein [Mesorhizobium sp. B2-3-14]
MGMGTATVQIQHAAKRPSLWIDKVSFEYRQYHCRGTARRRKAASPIARQRDLYGVGESEAGETYAGLSELDRYLEPDERI